MSCCGSKRQHVVTRALPPAPGRAAAAAPTPNPPNGPAPASTVFVYDGAAALTVIGHATGRRYRFGERGARVAVDPRDAESIAGTPKLRRVAG